MTFGLDTSVVLRLLTGQPQELAARALARYQDGIANGDSFYHRVFGDGGTLEIDAIRSFIQGGVFVSNQLELETAALIAPGPQNFDLAVAIDLSVAYLGAEEMDHPFRVLEAVLPRVKRPLAICTFEKTL